MAGVDVTHVQVDGVTPRSLRTSGPYHVVAARLGSHSKVNIVEVLVFTNVGCPYTAQIGFEGIRDGLPVDKVSTMENGESRLIIKSRVGHVIVFTLAHNGRVGIVAAKYGVRERLSPSRDAHDEHTN
jgi:hypothetical protein